MKAKDIDAQPRDVQVESIRYFRKAGSKSGVVSIVVDGVHHMWTCEFTTALYFVEDLVGAIREHDDDQFKPPQRKPRTRQKSRANS